VIRLWLPRSAVAAEKRLLTGSSGSSVQKPRCCLRFFQTPGVHPSPSGGAVVVGVVSVVVGVVSVVVGVVSVEGVDAVVSPLA
jgi:hypothetical protein